MESGELIALFVLAAIAVIIVVAFLSRQPTRPQSYAPKPTPRPRSYSVTSPAATTIKPTSPGSGLEALFGLLVLGIAGAALYKFIQSGGLERLLNRIGELPIEVNGRMTTIAAAVNDEAEIRRLLLEAVQKRMSTLDDNGAAPTIDIDNGTAARDIADMLRDAIGQRMRERGI
jgi:hypothetical protein